MRYLLDTYVISDFIKGESGTTTKLKQTPPIEIAVSTIWLSPKSPTCIKN